MVEWWQALTTLNQVFFGVAAFFSILFLWQFVMTLLGIVGEGADVDAAVDADAAADVDVADFDADAGDVADFEADVDGTEVGETDTTLSFKLLSLRSVIAAGMLFGWAGALYLQEGVATPTALVYAAGWAVAGALVVALLLYWMRSLAETGTQRLATCIGRPATVYMNIPAGGTGKVRTVVSGAVRFVPARHATSEPLAEGTPVRVRRLLDDSTVEVERAASQGDSK